MFKNSSRATGLMKILVEVCTDVVIFAVIAGVIFVLDVINMIEERSEKKKVSVS